MKIYFDYQALIAQKYGGVSRYYYELICRLQKFEGVECDIRCICSQNEYFKNFPGVLSVGSYHWRVGEIIKEINKIYAKYKLMYGMYDIIHPTNYDPYFLENSAKKKIVTIHDMTQEIFKEYYSGDIVIDWKKRNIYESDHIIAISENTKQDILKIYPDIAPDKITVIYHGVTKLNRTVDYNDFNFPKEYILYVGNRYLYKNFIRFFCAIKPILDQSNIHLVCIGGGKFTPKEKNLIGIYNDRVHQYAMSDSGLYMAYSKAICFVFPSLYEGFGLPILEAYDCGCPVALSNTSSFLEVGGDAAVYFDPYDEESIREAVSKKIYDFKSGDNIDLKNEMKRQLTKFSWDNAARQLLKCYEEVLA